MTADKALVLFSFLIASARVLCISRPQITKFKLSYRACWSNWLHTIHDFYRESLSFSDAFVVYTICCVVFRDLQESRIDCSSHLISIKHPLLKMLVKFIRYCFWAIFVPCFCAWNLSICERAFNIKLKEGFLPTVFYFFERSAGANCSMHVQTRRYIFKLTQKKSLVPSHSFFHLGQSLRHVSVTGDCISEVIRNAIVRQEWSMVKSNSFV